MANHKPEIIKLISRILIQESANAEKKRNSFDCYISLSMDIHSIEHNGIYMDHAHKLSYLFRNNRASAAKWLTFAIENMPDNIAHPFHELCLHIGKSNQPMPMPPLWKFGEGNLKYFFTHLKDLRWLTNYIHFLTEDTNFKDKDWREIPAHVLIGHIKKCQEEAEKKEHNIELKSEQEKTQLKQIIAINTRYGRPKFEMANEILAVMRNAQNSDATLPNIEMRTEEIGLPTGYRMAKLADNDVRGAMSGFLTECCQHIGENGGACAKHSIESALGGNYALFKGNSPLVMSWAWADVNPNTGEAIAICFDSIEYSKIAHDTIKKDLGLPHELTLEAVINVIYTEFAQRMIAHPNCQSVQKISVGSGGNTPWNVGHKPLVSAHALRLTPWNKKDERYKGYRDSDSQRILAARNDTGYYQIHDLNYKEKLIALAKVKDLEIQSALRLSYADKIKDLNLTLDSPPQWLKSFECKQYNECIEAMANESDINLGLYLSQNNETVLFTLLCNYNSDNVTTMISLIEKHATAADINAGNGGKSCMSVALSDNNATQSLIEMMLKKGGDPNRREVGGKTFAYHLVTRCLQNVSQENYEKWINDYGFDLTIRDDYDNTVLSSAIKAGFFSVNQPYIIAVIDALKRKGVNLDPYLSYAIILEKNHKEEFIRCLLEKGAKPLPPERSSFVFINTLVQKSWDTPERIETTLQQYNLSINDFKEYMIKKQCHEELLRYFVAHANPNHLEDNFITHILSHSSMTVDIFNHLCERLQLKPHQILTDLEPTQNMPMVIIGYLLDYIEQHFPTNEPQYQNLRFKLIGMAFTLGQSQMIHPHFFNKHDIDMSCETSETRCVMHLLLRNALSNRKPFEPNGPLKKMLIRYLQKAIPHGPNCTKDDLMLWGGILSIGNSFSDGVLAWVKTIPESQPFILNKLIDCIEREWDDFFHIFESRNECVIEFFTTLSKKIPGVKHSLIQAFEKHEGNPVKLAILMRLYTAYNLPKTFDRYFTSGDSTQAEQPLKSHDKSGNLFPPIVYGFYEHPGKLSWEQRADVYARFNNVLISSLNKPLPPLPIHGLIEQTIFEYLNEKIWYRFFTGILMSTTREEEYVACCKNLGAIPEGIRHYKDDRCHLEILLTNKPVNDLQESVLSHAIKSNQLFFITHALSLGADPLHLDPNGRPAYALAVYENNWTCLASIQKSASIAFFTQAKANDTRLAKKWEVVIERSGITSRMVYDHLRRNVDHAKNIHKQIALLKQAIAVNADGSPAHLLSKYLHGPCYIIRNYISKIDSDEPLGKYAKRIQGKINELEKTLSTSTQVLFSQGAQTITQGADQQAPASRKSSTPTAVNTMLYHCG